MDGHRAAERMAVDEALVRLGLQARQVLPGDQGILIDAALGRQGATALAKAAVVHRQDGKAHGVQLFDAKQLAGQVPARAMQIEQGRGILARCRPPPGVQALIGTQFRRLQLHVLDAGGQAAEPVGCARLDAKHQFALGLFQLGAADRQQQQQAGQHGQAQTTAAQQGEPGRRHGWGSRTTRMMLPWTAQAVPGFAQRRPLWLPGITADGSALHSAARRRAWRCQARDRA